MRELTTAETEQVAGGIDTIGILTGINLGLRVGAVGAVLGASWMAGYKVGTAIYNTYTHFRY